ncbi:MAG: hypothetical protein SFV55_11195 [Haliscomenobacter sp.]|uniref:hypothetical protein n=1 Tax=Haliscomenobacter sp. TaxID=2717303 RepID=UPI0029ACD7BB|nr:hypothetical protein [Haliscomenobacter sp.]MDX2068983.1 hypothetical protein [Haliscomenobacter sp.]
MYRNSFSRLAHLIKIEWGKKWKSLIGSSLLYMVVIIMAIMIPTQVLTIAIDFFVIHFIIGLVFVFGNQLFLLFTEWRSPFATIQLLQLPAKPIEKYLSKLCFPFLFAPVTFILFFFIFRPLFLQATFAIMGFMVYPLYREEINNLIQIGLLLPLFLGALFVPGALVLKKAHLLVSFFLISLLFVLAGIIAWVFQLPAYVTSSVIDQFIGGAIGAQVESFFNFFRIKSACAVLYWYGGIIPLMLISGYLLFKQREI